MILSVVPGVRNSRGPAAGDCLVPQPLRLQLVTLTAWIPAWLSIAGIAGIPRILGPELPTIRAMPPSVLCHPSNVFAAAIKLKTLR